MEKLVNTDFNGLIALDKPIKFDDLTVFGCLYNETTDLKEMHQFFCYLIAREVFILNGGIADSDKWRHHKLQLSFTCEDGMIKFFEYLFGRSYRYKMFELQPDEKICYSFGEVEMNNIIIDKALIERYENIISEDGRK